MISVQTFTLLHVATGLFALASPALVACPKHDDPSVIGSLGSPAISEASGLAVSRDHSGVLWIHNDSGDTARCFALSQSGALLGTYSLAGAINIDWEDMAIGPAPGKGSSSFLYFGDIGDNLNQRPNIQVYRVAEPTVSLDQSPVTMTLSGVEKITLAYPDGPRDAETLMVDTNGDIYIVSKRVTPLGRMYRAAFPQSATQTITMELIAELPWGSVSGAGGATGGDIASDGRAVIIRRYSNQTPQGTLWLRPPGTPLGDVFKSAGCDIALASEPQGEAIAFEPASLTYLTVSEGVAPPIYRFEFLPAPADLNRDGIVNGLDLALLLGAWGACPSSLPGPPVRSGGVSAPLTSPASARSCLADLNADGMVSGFDLAMLLGAWG